MRACTAAGRRRPARRDDRRTRRGRLHLGGGHDCDQSYARYCARGSALGAQPLTDVVGPKRTALARAVRHHGQHWSVGSGDDAEPVAEMMFRILKFRRPRRPSRGAARATAAPRAVLRPVVNRDTEFFWAGMAAGELRVWRCGECGLLGTRRGRCAPGVTPPARST